MTEIPGMVERVAGAIYANEMDDCSPGWEKCRRLYPGYAAKIMDKARNAIAAQEAALRDAGLVIVPREATWLMLVAGRLGFEKVTDGSKMAAAWDAMVAAAHRCSTTNPQQTKYLDEDRCSSTALSPSAAPSVDRWQPIESAPKDGAELLVWCDDGEETSAAVAFWHTRYNKWIEGGPWNEVVPTHWMPLPVPPTGLVELGRGSNTDPPPTTAVATDPESTSPVGGDAEAGLRRLIYRAVTESSSACKGECLPCTILAAGCDCWAAAEGVLAAIKPLVLAVPPNVGGTPGSASNTDESQDPA